MEMEHSTDHGAPSKSFTRESSSSSPSSSSNSHTNSKVDRSKQQASDSPQRPSAPEPASPPQSPSTPNASVNGHAPESNEEVRQVPSQSPSHVREGQAYEAHRERGNRTKGNTERDDAGLLLGSDPDDADDLGSGESDGDWSQDDIEADIRRVKVRT
jgi:protein phosphatase-4 regulatory subunit 3